MKPRHLLSLLDLDKPELDAILTSALELKRARGTRDTNNALRGKTVAMIFSKSSTRTRVSFEVGIHELGGYSLFLDHNDLQLGRGETMQDTAQVLSRYVHGVIIRAHQHASLLEYAEHSTVPVINALTDRFHPCQLLADLLTLYELKKRVEGLTVAYVGDGANNMANSWILAAKLAGIHLCIGAPPGYQPDPAIIAAARGSGTITVTADPAAAVRDADAVYTDVWVSMGYESETDSRLVDLRPYQVNSALLQHAKPDISVMHCLPAKRGQEITSEVIDGPQSIVWDQAENRLHAQKAVLVKLIR